MCDEVEESAAGDWRRFARRDGQSQEAGFVRGQCRLAAQAHSLGAIHLAEVDTGTGGAGRAGGARKRTCWKTHQGRIDASRLVFIDETWIKTNMALRHDRISAPWVIDGPINGELFTLYVDQVLAPILAKGDVVILDNLGSHKGKAARNAIRAKGAHLLFLTPYSPDLNPIEQVFAKLKHLLRAAEPRDVEATWRKADELLDLFSNEECANYLKNSGYVSV